MSQTEPTPRSARPRSRAPLLAGFGLLLAVIAALIALGLARMERSSRQIGEIAAAQGRSIETAAELFLSNGQRAASISRLLSAQTPQARAAAHEQYRRAVEAYARALEKLRALEPARAEAAAFEQALVAAERAQATGEEIVAHLMRGQGARASELGRARAALEDSRLQEALSALIETMRARGAQATAVASRDMRAGLVLIGAGSMLALLAAAALAVQVARLVAGIGARLEREKELAEVTLHSIEDGVITTDAAGRVEYLNPVAERYLGWTAGQARGRRLAEVFRVIDERSGAPIEPLPLTSQRTASGDEPAAVRLVDRNGRECPVRYSHAPIRARDGTVRGAIVVFHDVSQIRALAQQLLWQASHDALTGLVNRREFERRLAELVETARSQRREHALLYLDLDNFKAVNDTCGHGAGDELLRQLTAIMLSRMRASDTLARLGGDEFGVLLETCPVDQALRVANALRETVRDFRFVWEGKTFSVGVSIGLVPITAESESAERLLATADACCYEAKSRGRDRVQVHRPSDSDEGAKHEELRLLSQINRAFELGQFRLYCQRIVPLDPAAGRAPHHEVLVRMVDRDGNLLPATGFMPAAERYNLLTSIERWVVSSLVEYLHRQWTAGAIPHALSGSGERGYYSVNISGASINDRSFPDFLGNLLTRYQLPHGLLCLEITETTAISSLSKAAELMHELKGMGCRIALDDFGTGMSSFAYLKYLPVDYLKIAGVFIQDMRNDPMDYAIVEAIARISRILGMLTVAESVEDAETLMKLRELGVDYAQGYFVAEPEALGEEPEHKPPSLTA
ncbi:MAG TPA: EAL domain-containing protein [Burkholderiales bacterium]|nr:EAL domain-containing protein [Burkholderiales bacterium]